MEASDNAARRRNGHGQPVLVDIAIPTRGQQLTYLSEALDSVVSQSADSWRLTVSENGGGSAEVAALLEPYLADERVRHVVVPEALDQAAHFTRLIRSGDAPYVALLHDDDRWGPGYLERRIAFLDSHPDAAFVFSGHMVIDDAGRIVGHPPFPFAEGVYEPSTFLPVLYRENVVAIPTIVVRRTAYEAVGADYRRDVGFNDHDMWFRIGSRFPVGFLEARDAFYRVHPHQASSRQRLEVARRRLQLLDIVDADLPIPDSLRKRVRAEVLLKSALDEAELGERRAALGTALEAVRLFPRTLLSVDGATRVSALCGTLVLGRAGRWLLTRSRLRQWRRHGAV